jgi:hypothetical protein
VKYICVEKDEEIERTVTPMSLDPAEVLRVYDKLKGVPNLFVASGVCSAKTLEQLYDPAYHFWLVDDVGIICIAPVASGKGHAHITFWDGRLRGREGLAREFAKAAMAEHGLHTLITAIPLDSRATLAFAKRVGFRTAMKYNEFELLHFK